MASNVDLGEVQAVDLHDLKGIGEASDTAVRDAFNNYGVDHPEVFGQQPADGDHRARVAPDDVARAHPPRCQRALDRLGDLLRRHAAFAGAAQHPVDRLGDVAVLLAQLVGHLEVLGFGASLVPDRRRDRAGLDERDLHARRAQLDAQRVADRLYRVLGGGVGSGERHRDAAADGRDEDDPSASGAQRGQHRLRDGDLADDVDVELAANVVDGNQLERTADADPGVVDERVESTRAGAASRGQQRGGVCDLPRVGHVEGDRLDACAATLGRFGGEPAPGRIVAHAREHRPACAREPQRGRLSDPGGGARDEGRRHR